MMSKKQSGWNKVFANTKTNKPMQKKRGEELGPFIVPVTSGAKEAGGSSIKSSLSCGRCNSAGGSVISRRGDGGTAGSKVGVGLSKGSCVGHQGTRASHPARPASSHPARPASHPARPASHPARPASHPARPASSHPARPASHPARPASHPARPASHPARPASSHPARPASHPARPASHPARPASHPARPASSHPARPASHPARPAASHPARPASSHPARPASHPAGPASHPARPASHPARPASSHPARPASHPARPAFLPARSASHPARPASHPARPASSHPARPASHPARPASSHPARPASHPARPASHPARPAACLRSSRSSPSLHTSSLSAAPLMRSCRSLSKLNQSPFTGEAGSEHAVLRSQVKTEHSSPEQTAVDSGPLSSPTATGELFSATKDQCGGDNAEKMETSTSSEPSSPSSVVSTAACHQHCNKIKKPDLLNFKKGWLMRKDADGQWQKHWFVLTDQILRFYRDPMAEEAAGMDGEMNLSTCYEITDYPTQKNYGFQMHTKDGVYTLCAMTSGIRRNWIQAVLKNVRPTFTPDVTSSTPLKSQTADSQSLEVVGNTPHQKNRVGDRCREGRYTTFDWTEAMHQQQKEQESGNVFSHHRPLLIGTTQTDGTDASYGVATSQCEAVDSDSSSSTLEPSNDERYDEHSNMGDDIEQRWQQVETGPLSEERPISTSTTYLKEKEKLSKQKTGQLVRELEQTQKELSRLQQFNRSLQDQLLHEIENKRERERIIPQSGLPNSSSAQALTLQQLQKINHDLCFELEEQRMSHEEARAHARIHLEQDLRHFDEQQEEWERCVASLQSQLTISEEQRREAESCLKQLPQESQGYQALQQEADRLREQLQDVTARLCANNEAQAQKEVRLQKHLVLLQESQDRERRSLAASLTQAEQHSQDLQQRLERAMQQVESLNKGQSWTREIEEAQQQLQEELACTVSAVQRLQEEREQFNCRCQELQNQLAEADGEVSRLQNRLKTEETHYYNLEHSYERVCEELQLAVGHVQGREVEAQDIREGYERLLDRKEQELNEVLVKMEVLGTSLEETEVKLTEVLKVCTCVSSQQTTESALSVNDSNPNAKSSSQSSSSLDAIDAVQINGNSSQAEHTRTRSRSIDPSYQCIVTAGDDPDRFMSVIQFLETKLYVTEEKLRDITQKLEVHQSHINCQDPHLCSQLTHSRATAQHLSLLLHSQAKQSQRFAQETESRSRVLVDRFQAALKIIEACGERLQTLLKNQGESSTAVDFSEFEKQLATAVACLHQGEKDAEKQQHESYYACKGEDKMISPGALPGAEINISVTSRFPKMSPLEEEMGRIGRTLMREVLVVEKMVSVLQRQHGQLHIVSGEDEGGVAHRYKSMISQRIALEMEKGNQMGKVVDNNESLENTIGTVCAEAELIYNALKLQRQYERMTQEHLQVNDQASEHLWQVPGRSDYATVVPSRGLADISPPELAPYEEQVQVQVERRGLKEAAKPLDREQSITSKVEVEKKQDWLERLISQLQRRAKVVRQLCQEISDCNGPHTESSVHHNWVNYSAIDLNWVQQEAKLIYLSDRLYLDLELELQRSKVMHDKLQTMRKEQDIALIDEQQAFSHTLFQLQEDNNELREQLESAEQHRICAETGNQQLLEDIQKIGDYHEDRMQKLEKEFQEKIRQLQEIHEEEMKHLHNYYAKSACISKDKQTKSCIDTRSPTETVTSSPDLSLSSGPISDELIMDGPNTEGDADAMREAFQKDFEKLKASCDQGFTDMEEMHRSLVGDLQQQHQREVAALLKEKDRLLKEETAATMAAIAAMRTAHKEELQKSKWSQQIRESADTSQLHAEYEKEIRLLHKELEVLSVQHTQKCVENSQMIRELQAERHTSLQYQRENQELKSKQELTQAVLEDVSHMRSSLNGKQSDATSRARDLYEMEVVLRVKDAEMQFLRQETLSLREELKTALMDKTYSQSELKALYANSQDKPPQYDVTEPSEDFKYATWSPTGHRRDNPTSGQGHGDTVTNTSNVVLLKKTERTSLTPQIRGVRSKSLKGGLSAQERMKLFESF